jgi:DNA (cytosine-5)-methyltransferase 1
VAESNGLSVVGLFAGIGGIEEGLRQAGHEATLLCEIDCFARTVLKKRYPEVALHDDVRTLKKLPRADLVAAGFPCQDLSQAGKTAGIRGKNSGLVEQVFRLIESSNGHPTWLLLENVPFMLQLDGGTAMRYLTTSLGSLGFKWAYRIVDTRAFGLPHRRRRVILLASRTEDPCEVLFQSDVGPREKGDWQDFANGFYWTEGTKGLGWAVDAVPTLKGGSTIGIPSPPAIWMPDGRVVTPEVRDSERLQGFAPNWTAVDAVQGVRRELRPLRPGQRWKMIGNAVSVPVAKWVGQCLMRPRAYIGGADPVLQEGDRWPTAAWGMNSKAFRAELSPWPVHRKYRHLQEFLRYATPPLSLRAAKGFRRRTRSSSLRFPAGLLDAIDVHVEALSSVHVASKRHGAAATLF